MNRMLLFVGRYVQWICCVGDRCACSRWRVRRNAMLRRSKRNSKHSNALFPLSPMPWLTRATTISPIWFAAQSEMQSDRNRRYA